MSNSIKHYYLSTPFAKDSKAKDEKSKTDLVSNLWAMFTAMETVEYSSRNLAQHFVQNQKRMLNQVCKYNREMKSRIFGANLSRLQSEQLNEGVLNSSAMCIEAMGYALGVPDKYLDEFLLALENKSKELQTRFSNEQKNQKADGTN